MARLRSEIFNIILIILIFVIPLLAIDLSYYFISNINYDLSIKNQKKKAIHEAETLAVEGNFSIEFAMHFQDFLKKIQNIDNISNLDDSSLANNFEQISNKIFEKPFPNYNLYVFKISGEKRQTNLVYCNKELKGKRALCLDFEYLYRLSIGEKAKNIPINPKIVKALLGDYTDINTVAFESRGITTNTNGLHNNSWFIWDYTEVADNTVFGAILVCDEMDDYALYGRLLALKRLKSRNNAIGAFIPIYKDYGEANIPPPLDKSDTFKNWANSLTIQNPNELEKWLIDSLPQSVSLGNYSAFCHFDRSDTHIAIILVKSITKLFCPKWLLSINLLTFSGLIIILYCGFVLKSWPQLNLKIRFTLSYILASVIPLSLLSVTAYAYLLQYENTKAEEASNDLQLSIKAFDENKLTKIKEYRVAFSKAVNDEILKELLTSNNPNEEKITDRVVEIFEKSDPQNPLPILGAKIYNEAGEGAFSKGSATTHSDIQNFFDSFSSMQVDILRSEILRDDPKAKLEEYKANIENTFAGNAYKNISGRDPKEDLNKHFATPLPRKNGDFCSYHIFNTIKINGKTKYMLLVAWNDDSLDDDIIQKSFYNYATKKLNQNFIAFRIKGQKIDSVGKKSRHSPEIILNNTGEFAKQASYFKKTDTFIHDDKIIVVKPALNFSKIVFVGWIDKIIITKDVFERELIFIILIIISLLTLWICSLRSASVFLRPVSTLKKALDEVSSGNLNIGFQNVTNDELGNLTEEFDKMIGELREKERISKLISDQAVQALQKNSSGLLNDTETFKGVALVSDIRNFTGMSEKYDPEIITELLNNHFAEMAKIISLNGGLIYKFIGDAIEAVFPEKTEYEQPATERAFKAGCMMIMKLAQINNRRKKIDLFTYRIGVGLCYGTLYSGSVGSLETRLDYSIIGDCLEKAAKFEALSIQNPDFPLVIGENIAEKMARYGLGFRKIDSKNQDFSVYTFNEITNSKDASLPTFDFKFVEPEVKEEKAKENIKLFSILDNTSFYKKRKDSYSYCFLILFFSIFITLGINVIYFNYNSNLALESENLSVRLIEQLKCDEVLKSCFETLCFDFYEEIYKALNSDDNKSETFKQKIEKIAKKYERLQCPIPKYYCLLYSNDDKDNTNEVNKGFDNVGNIIKKFAIALKNDSENEANETIKILTGPETRKFDMVSSHYRRSSMAKINNEELLIDTDKIHSKNEKEIIAYIFCGMPKNINPKLLSYYYTLLAGKQSYLSIKNQYGVYFSPDFPEEEKKNILNPSKLNYLTQKGYKIIPIEINNENSTVYIISKDLYNNYCPLITLNVFSFTASILLLGLIFWIAGKSSIFGSNSIVAKLRKDIVISALFPLLAVCLVSYLFVNEDSNVKKGELNLNLNKLMDEIETKEYYYQPFCENILKNLPHQKEFNNYIQELNNSDDEKRQDISKNFRNYLLEKVMNRRYQNLDTFCTIKEMIIISKNGWILEAKEPNKNSKDTSETTKDTEAENKRDDISEFAYFLSKVFKTIYFKTSDIEIDKVDTKNFEGEEIIDKMLKTLATTYGDEFSIKLANFPNSLMVIVNSFSSAGYFIGTFPDRKKPEYIVISFIFFELDFKSHICSLKNNNPPYEQHLASGATGSGTYSFYSPNISVGEYFFYNGDKFFNPKENLKTVKELGLISSWINTSFVPVSRKVDINGSHFLEARQGYHAKDTVYAALASEYPIKENSIKLIKTIISILVFSLLMILLIAQSIISDLLEPIKQLVKGAVAASKGKYKFRTNFKRKDELGALCRSFDQMMKGLEEKQLMNRMISKSALEVTSNLSEIGSKKVDVALLYVTVPDFYKIMKETQPFELFTKLRKQIAIISEIAINNGGDIDKIMGEKMLIAFHSGNKTPEEVAVDSAKVAYLIESCDKLYFKVSVGVNYGKVISGYLGVGEKRDFTIIGDPVNVAARIAVFAEKLDSNRLVVSEQVKNLIKKEIKTEEYGEVLFKGKTQPSTVYRIISS